MSRRPQLPRTAIDSFRRCQQPRRHAPRTDSDRTRGARDGNRSPRHRIDVAADAKGIADALAFELRRKLGPVDREIAIRLVVRSDDDTGEDSFGVHTDEDFDRTVVAALE